MALNLAIAELQKATGVDTRITATADVVVESNPRQLLGVWRSWEGIDHDPVTGMPRAQTADGMSIYDIKNENYEKGSPSSGRFIKWLVSGSDTEDVLVTPEILTGTVPMVGRGSLGDAAEESLLVSLNPVDIQGNGGRSHGSYAWWVHGENQKALVKMPEDEPESAFEWTQNLSSNPDIDPEELGIEQLEQLDSLFSRQTLNLTENTSANSAGISGEYFYDVSTSSRGLLTNVANGGWKRDLSLFSELQEAGKIPLDEPVEVFSLSPEQEHRAYLLMANNGASAALYPFANDASTSMSWNAIADYLNLYKSLKLDSTSATPYYEHRYNSTNNDDYVTISPVTASQNFTLSYSSRKSGNNYTPYIHFLPTYTYWNPYNVAVTFSGASNRANWVDAKNLFPVKITMEVGGSEYEVQTNKLFSKKNRNDDKYRYSLNWKSSSDTIVKPGETRVFAQHNAAENPTITAGYDGVGGISQTLSNVVEKNLGTFPGSTSMSADWEHKGGKLSSTIPEHVVRNSKGYQGSSQTVQCPAEQLELKIPLPENLNPSKTMSDPNVEGAHSPFLSLRLSLKNFYESAVKTKGFLFNKPIVTGTSTNSSYMDLSSYEWRVFSHTGINDTTLAAFDHTAAFDPEAKADTVAYIGPSPTAENGLSHFVTNELPIGPLLSMGDLQHFDQAFNNPNPPYVHNAIGNSNAVPHVAADQVVHSTALDHSYLSNHLLMDDWFISSISQPMNDFGVLIEETYVNVYQKHLEGEPLENAFYLPAQTYGDGEEAAQEHLERAKAWQSIASELTVEGAFNINSTSVKAWKALLLANKDASVPYITIDSASQASWKIDNLSPYTEQVPIPRTQITGEQGVGAGMGVAITETFVLTEEQAEALATEIVAEVRERGPFLSMSEFFNRQLTTAGEKSLAGAVESALIALSELPADDSKNPYGFIKQEVVDDEGNEILASANGDVGYQYQEAAQGSAAYGMPGWARQADVLRHMMPVMTARDDTFTIRAYGDSKDSSGNIVAKAWCEALVVRSPEYVDSAADSKITKKADLQSEENAKYGRKYKIISFRWLNEKEI
ncbi:hypothetical protein ACFSQZ_10350 [Rubritalea spongiae]|uniref:Uncharacterized protein n=2 Tax=Rubritalea spongiae TaxID=430797 RepID=A0ABW5E2N2_9BACT